MNPKALWLSLICILAIAVVPVARATDPEALAKVLDALGGRKRLEGLQTLVVESSGDRRDIDQYATPGTPDPIAESFKEVAYYDMAHNRMRLEITRKHDGVDQPHSATYVLREWGGVVSGEAERFGPPRTDALTSDRWAAIRREQTLLNPILLLSRALIEGTLRASADTVRNGSKQHVLSITTPGAPIQLFVNPDAGYIEALETIVTDHMRRDTSFAVSFAGWAKAAGGLAYPTSFSVAYDGEVIHTEKWSPPRANAAHVTDAMFAFPEGISPQYDGALAAWGGSSGVYLMNEAYGSPMPGQQTDVEVKQLKPDVYLLCGGGYNSLVVGQKKGVVVVDAPLHEKRSATVMDFAKRAFPGKGITHLIATHHHTDHQGGVRRYAGAGAIIVAHELTTKYLGQIVKRASDSRPDALSRNPRAVEFEPVPAEGSLRIDDERYPIRIYPLPSSHAQDMVALFVEGAGVIFVTDIYSPNPNAKTIGAGGASLQAWIQKHAIRDVSLIAGGHGSSIDYKVFETLPER